MAFKIDDEAFISNSREWPQWPFLPVKNTRRKDGQGPLCGVVVESSGKVLPAVFLANLFDLPELYKSGKTLKDVDKIEYPTVAAIVADGWIVD